MTILSWRILFKQHITQLYDKHMKTITVIILLKIVKVVTCKKNKKEDTGKATGLKI